MTLLLAAPAALWHGSMALVVSLTSEMQITYVTARVSAFMHAHRKASASAGAAPAAAGQ